MTLSEAIAFLTPCKVDDQSPSVWTDLGCGTGLFTYALAALLARESRIYAIDKQTGFVQRQNNKQVEINPYRVDFVNQELPFSAVSGIMMANALHYVKNKGSFISKMK